MLTSSRSLLLATVAEKKPAPNPKAGFSLIHHIHITPPGLSHPRPGPRLGFTFYFTNIIFLTLENDFSVSPVAVRR